MPTVHGTVNSRGQAFNFREIQYGGGGHGGGQRGIYVGLNGGGTAEFSISPNPHDNPAYNRHQDEFYQTVAQAIADNYTDPNGANNNWDQAGGTAVFRGETYNLTYEGMFHG